MAILEKFTMFGPQQTAGVAAGSMPCLSVAPPARSWQMHDLPSTLSRTASRCSSVRSSLRKLLELELLVLARRGADRTGGELRVEQPDVALRARAAGPVLLDPAAPGLLAGRRAQIPEGQPERRTVAQVDVAVGRVAQLLEMLVVDVGDFGHQQERGGPAGAVRAVVLPQKGIFLGGADAALHGDADRMRPSDRRTGRCAARAFTYAA